jgi:hypothetical protein
LLGREDLQLSEAIAPSFLKLFPPSDSVPIVPLKGVKI